MKNGLFAALLVFTLVPGVPAGALDVPPFEGAVMDQAGIISPTTIKRISLEISQFEEQSGIAMAVLTLNSLEGESLEEYATRVSESWKMVGKEREGVLFVMSVDDRVAHVAVSDRLREKLSEEKIQAVLKETMTPLFRRKVYGLGMRLGLGEFMSLLSK